MLVLAGLIPHEAPRLFLLLRYQHGSRSPALLLSPGSLSNPQTQHLKTAASVEAAQSHCTSLLPGMRSIQMCSAQCPAVSGLVSSCAILWIPIQSSASSCAAFAIQLCRAPHACMRLSIRLSSIQMRRPLHPAVPWPHPAATQSYPAVQCSPSPCRTHF